jgi:hypothetical protein
MRTFIYKRTHQGDPDSQGWFGNEDCMGSLRSCNFNAVIGIGGICDWAERQGISRKLNWIGIGPTKHPHTDRRGPVVTFKHFLLFEDDGIDFHAIAPALAGRLLRPKAARFLFSDDFNKIEQEEVNRILKLAKAAPSSAKHYRVRKRNNGHCVSKRCKVNPIPLAVSRRCTSCAVPPVCGSSRSRASR